MTAVAPQFIREPRQRRSLRVRWFGGRALLLHLTLLVVFPVCLLAAWWQIQRALSGNTLSFVYVFEWPAFAGVAVWAWWALLTKPDGEEHHPARLDGSETPAAGRAREQRRLVAERTRPLQWDRDQEGAGLRAYNAYLAEINARPPRGRLPRRPRGGRRE